MLYSRNHTASGCFCSSFQSSTVSPGKKKKKFDTCGHRGTTQYLGMQLFWDGWIPPWRQVNLLILKHFIWFLSLLLPDNSALQNFSDYYLWCFVSRIAISLGLAFPLPPSVAACAAQEKFQQFKLEEQQKLLLLRMSWMGVCLDMLFLLFCTKTVPDRWARGILGMIAIAESLLPYFCGLSLHLL